MAYTLKEEDLPPTTLAGSKGNHFSDFIPEEEEADHPGMGMGNLTQDWIPEGTTAPELARAKARLEQKKQQDARDRERLEHYKVSEAAKRPR